MTEAEVRAIVRGIAPVIKTHVRTAIAEVGTDALADVIVQTIAKAIEPLKARIAELESRGGEYKVFKLGETYACGSVVKWNGGLWRAVADTTLIPGSHPTCWKSL